jgi:ectoine hydroxylase-related dioxygenase (phytanoyl-CoA dioxygenase family)
MSFILSAEQLSEYERDGCICPIRALDASEAAAFRHALEEQETAMGGLLRRMDNCHLFFRWAHNLATHPRILDILEDLLGPDLFVHSTRIFYKHAHDRSYVSWHQDGRYSSLNSKPAPSVWIALSDSTPENGCLRVVPGSHRSGVHPHVETFAPDNLLNHGEEICVRVDESAVRDFVLEPGEMSLHHVNLVHGSNPNLSPRCRIGFAISYMTPAVRHSTLPVVRARGNSNDHEFKLWSHAPKDSMEEAVKAHAAFVAAHGLQSARVTRTSD